MEWDHVTYKSFRNVGTPFWRGPSWRGCGHGSESILGLEGGTRSRVPLLRGRRNPPVEETGFRTPRTLRKTAGDQLQLMRPVLGGANVLVKASALCDLVSSLRKSKKGCRNCS